MKTLLTLSAGLLLGASALADHHMPAQPVVYGQSYGVVVSDPAALVAAMQKYRASATGRQMLSSVTLSQNVANGEQRATHTINVFYASADDMDASMRLAAGSADATEFGNAFRAAATLESDNLFTLQMSKINQQQIENPATMLFGLNVTDPAAFMAALNTLFASAAAASFPGNLYFGSIVAMGDAEGSHWVSFQASSVGRLLTGVDAFMKTADFADYLENADDFRAVTTRLVSRQLLSLQPPAPQE